MLMKDLIPSVVHICQDDEIDFVVTMDEKTERQEYRESYQKDYQAVYRKTASYKEAQERYRLKRNERARTKRTKA